MNLVFAGQEKNTSIVVEPYKKKNSKAVIKTIKPDKK